MQAELNLPLWRTDSIYLAEVAVVDAVVRISIADNVEDVEKVGAESEDVFAPNVEILKEGSIHLAIAGSALRVDACRAERRKASVGSDAVRANTIVRAEARSG